jgi:putative ABC transport system ATP-binding protein
MASSDQQIDARGISKSYQMGVLMVNALKNVDLRINRGEFLVALGPSGSGKTTLLNLIGGIDTVSAGDIIVNGTDITSLDDRRLTDFRRNNFGYVFQFFNLIPTLTALENVEFAADLVGHPADSLEMLSVVGLSERANHFPSELSGGEQQRVAIARALVKDPPILLCDEPTGELDYETGKNILSTIRNLSKEKGKTVLLVTHNSAIGDIADRVIKLRSGGIVEDTQNERPIDPQQLKW